MDGSNTMRPQSLDSPDKAPTLPDRLPRIFHGLGGSPQALVNKSSHQPPPRGGVQGGGSLLHSQAPLDVNAGMDISHAQSPRLTTASPIKEKGTLNTNKEVKKRKARHPLDWLHHRPKTQALTGKADIPVSVEGVARPQPQIEASALVNPTTAPVDQEEPPASTPTVERRLLHKDGVVGLTQHQPTGKWGFMIFSRNKYCYWDGEDDYNFQLLPIVGDQYVFPSDMLLVFPGVDRVYRMSQLVYESVSDTKIKLLLKESPVIAKMVIREEDNRMMCLNAVEFHYNPLKDFNTLNARLSRLIKHETPAPEDPVSPPSDLVSKLLSGLKDITGSEMDKNREKHMKSYLRAVYQQCLPENETVPEEFDVINIEWRSDAAIREIKVKVEGEAMGLNPRQRTVGKRREKILVASPRRVPPRRSSRKPVEAAAVENKTTGVKKRRKTKAVEKKNTKKKKTKKSRVNMLYAQCIGEPDHDNPPLSTDEPSPAVGVNAAATAARNDHEEGTRRADSDCTQPPSEDEDANRLIEKLESILRNAERSAQSTQEAIRNIGQKVMEMASALKKPRLS